MGIVEAGQNGYEFAGPGRRKSNRTCLVNVFTERSAGTDRSYAGKRKDFMTLILKSIAEEEADCRSRCAGMKVGDLILHCHHEVLCEILTEPVEKRINYILESKNDNPALRLRLMGPPIEDATVLSDAEWSKARAECSKADAECSKARAELSKAYAEWSKAYAECSKAYAECSKAYEPHYVRLYPDSPWNGKTIFPSLYNED